MEEIIEDSIESKKTQNVQMPKLTIWRVFAYFIIYSIVGYILETIFAFLVSGVIESRQSFLYGPFCAIYGVGAVAMIFTLRYFNKNNYTLFIAGYIIGTILEYIISWIAEVILNTRWWDYTNEFLNINGRVCLTYSIFWGLLAVYLMKSLNPMVDKFIDWLSSKINIKVGRVIVSIVIVFMLYDCVISMIAHEWIMSKVVVENNLDVNNKEIMQKRYDEVYNDEKLKTLVDEHWNVERILYTHPNLSINLKDGTKVYIRELYPEIHPYLYRARPDPVVEKIQNIEGEQ